jgi:hypothetical protein
MREPAATLPARAQGQIPGNAPAQLPGGQLGGAQQSGALNARDSCRAQPAPLGIGRPDWSQLSRRSWCMHATSPPSTDTRAHGRAARESVLKVCSNGRKPGNQNALNKALATVCGEKGANRCLAPIDPAGPWA